MTPNLPMRRDWRVESFARGAGGALAGAWGERLGEEIAARAAHLMDEEAVVFNAEEQGEPVSVLLFRVGEAIWAGIRKRFAVWEDLGELARVYSVLAQSSDATVVTDMAGDMLAASRRWREMYGYGPGELMGRNPKLVNSRQHPGSYYQKLWQELTDRETGTWSGEIVNRRRNGELVRIWQTITTVRDRDGHIQGYLGVTRDMTEHLAAREQLKRQNQELTELNRFKGEMVEIMAHDLKSPLQAVMGYAELLQYELEDARCQPCRERVTGIFQIGKGMLELIENFLELQRAEARRLTIEPRRGNLRGLLRSLVERQNVTVNDRQVRVVLEEAGPVYPVFFDSLRMEQAVHNVVANAVKFTRRGTEVVVRVRSAWGEPIRIEVEDAGPGLPAGALETIFDPYRQIQEGGRRAGSVGWGLAIARRVMELHGGRSGRRTGRKGVAASSSHCPTGMGGMHRPSIRC